MQRAYYLRNCFLALCFALTNEFAAAQSVPTTSFNDPSAARAFCRKCLANSDSISEAAFAKAESGMAVCVRNDDPGGEATCARALAAACAARGASARALHYLAGGLKAAVRADDSRQSAFMLQEAGAACEKLGRHNSALRYFEQSLRAFEKLDDARGGAEVEAAAGRLLMKQDKPAAALERFKRSLALRKAAGSRREIAAAALDAGRARLQLESPEAAESFFKKSLEIFGEVGDRSGEADALVGVAQLAALQNNAAEARAAAEEALRLARLAKAPAIAAEAAGALALADSALGDLKSAYEHFELRRELVDSLHSAAQAKEIGRQEAEYEFGRKIAAREQREAAAAARRRMTNWIAAGLLTVVFAVAVLMARGYRARQKDNQQLAKRNGEIERQSAEISEQRDKLQQLNDDIIEQRGVLEQAHNKITGSVAYAARIQRALLPPKEDLNKGAETFVYFKPRDVVSGDFYWTHQLDEQTFLYAAADCTGHGVPGAFMSVLGATTLESVVREEGATRPDEILKLLDLGVRAALKQDESADGALDGMDVALIKLDKRAGAVEFSAAGRPLYLLRNGKIAEYRGARFPAGGAQHGEKTFPLVEIALRPGDRLFMWSDGVTDQFGGKRSRKFTPRRLKETLLAGAGKSLKAQGEAFAETFEAWQIDAPQLDDQLLIALEIS